MVVLSWLIGSLVLYTFTNKKSGDCCFFVGDETTHLVHFGDLRYFLRHFNEVHNSGLVQKSLYWLYRFFSITR